jgi:hypothetical protein
MIKPEIHQKGSLKERKESTHRSGWFKIWKINEAVKGRLQRNTGGLGLHCNFSAFEEEDRDHKAAKAP